MDQQKKFIIFVCIGLVISLGISALIYFWPQLTPKVSPSKNIQIATQAPGVVSGLKNSASGTIQTVSKDTVTILRADKVTETYRYNMPRMYVLFHNKLGAKGEIADLKVGQKIDFSSTTDNKGDKVVTSILIY